jgi:hypothetical protein
MIECQELRKMTLDSTKLHGTYKTVLAVNIHTHHTRISIYEFYGCVHFFVVGLKSCQYCCIKNYLSIERYEPRSYKIIVS